MRQLTFDSGDDVAGADAEPVGGGSFERRDDRQVSLAHLNRDPEPVIAAVLALLKLGVFLFREKIRVRIERTKHAADRSVDQVFRVDLGNVFLFHETQHLRVTSQEL